MHIHVVSFMSLLIYSQNKNLKKSSCIMIKNNLIRTCRMAVSNDQRKYHNCLISFTISQYYRYTTQLIMNDIVHRRYAKKTQKIVEYFVFRRDFTYLKSLLDTHCYIQSPIDSPTVAITHHTYDHFLNKLCLIMIGFFALS